MPLFLLDDLLPTLFGLLGTVLIILGGAAMGVPLGLSWYRRERRLQRMTRGQLRDLHASRRLRRVLRRL